MIKIMIVDDEILVRIGIKSIINWEQYGYSVVCEAGNFREAAEKIPHYQPHIILTDLMMDGMDGFDLIEYCIREYPSVKLVVLSSYNDFEYVRRAMKLGASDYIFKLTVKPDELLKVLGELKTQIDALPAGQDAIILRNISAIKSRLITTGIQQNYAVKADFLSEFPALGLNTDFLLPYALLYISIDGYVGEERKGASQLQLLKTSMENIVNEVVSAHHRAETYNYNAGDLIVVIHPAGGSLPSSVGEDFLTILDYTKRYLGISVSAAVSEVCAGLEALPQAVAQAVKALSARFYSRLGRLYLPGDPPGCAQMQELPRPEDLADALAAGSFALAEDYFNRLFSCLFTWTGVPAETARMRLLDAYGMLEHHSRATGADIGEIRDEAGFTFYDAILYYDFLESIRKACFSFLPKYKALCGENTVHGRSEILTIKRHVRENLAADLSVEAAADLVKMSKSYFSHLFKKETGISFIDYVNKTRIARAQELLHSTDMRVGEVSEAVGIANPNYFGILFKKLTGKTPGECRGAVAEIKESE